MGQIHQTSGAAVPFFVHDFHVISIASAAFDPITTNYDDDYVNPTQMADQHAEALYAKNGFLARPNADGAFYVVTWARYMDAIKGKDTIAKRRTALAALIPKAWNALAGSWIECPLVKVFGVNGNGSGSYVTVATSCEIGIIL